MTKVYLGRTWSGYEFLKIQKYKRKKGYRVEFVERIWGKGYFRRWTWQCKSPEEVVKKLEEVGLYVSDDIVEDIKVAFRDYK